MSLIFRPDWGELPGDTQNSPMSPSIRKLRISSACFRIFISFCAVQFAFSSKAGFAQSPPVLQSTAPSFFKDGTRYVDGKPFFSRAAWFGYNHWMTRAEAKSLGNFMAVPFEKIGSKDDFYTTAGFNTGYYSIWGVAWFDGKPYDPSLTRECFKRAKEAGQKVVLHLPIVPSESVTKKLNFFWVTDEGVKIPFGKTKGMHHNPDLQAQATRADYQKVFDAVRDEPLNIGYQLGTERWAYDYVRVGKDVSFDDYSLGQFREFLKRRFSLEQVSERYGNAKTFFRSWRDVFPPVSKRPLDFGKRELANYDVARWDWYCYREKQTANVWVRMIEEFQKMDGRGRPFSFEHGHGPYYSMGFHPFPEICARTKNFSVGNGDFTGDLVGTLSTMIQVKGCGKGPWTNNELDAGTTNRHLDAADQRRKIWGTTALGASGFHLWTFFNLLGASSEFMDGTYFDPKLYDNMPLKYFEVQHSNRMLESLGQTLAASKSPAPRVALLLLDDSIFLNTLAIDYRPEGENLCRALSTRGLADQLVLYTKYHLDDTNLDNIQAIVLPRMPRLTDERARKLAEFVHRGGTLILMGPTGHFNELFQEQQSYPYGILGEAAGVRMNGLKSDEVREASIDADWGGRTVHLDVQVGLTIREGSKAEVIATADGKPVATRHQYGKGVCYSLAGYPFLTEESDPTGDFVVSMLTAGGVRPAVTVEQNTAPDTGVFTARRSGPNGTLIFLIENANTAHKLEVKLDPLALGLDSAKTYSVFECFSNETHRVFKDAGYCFATELEPVGVRAYLVTEAATLDAIIPQKQRYLISRDPDFIIEARASAGKPYLASSALRETLAWRRGRTVTAETVGAKPPQDMGDGFKALDLAPFTNSPLNRMLKDSNDSTFVNYGNTEASSNAGAALGFTIGKNLLGSVPFFSNGRYLAMEARSEVSRIPLREKVKSLHFFHGGQRGQNASSLGFYRVHYSDGTTLDIPIVVGVTLADFNRAGKFPSKTQVITTVADSKNRKINLQRYDWRNPNPDKEIDSLDIVATPTGDPRTFDIWAISAKGNE